MVCSITDPACFQQSIPLLQQLPISQDLKTYLLYHTIPESQCQPFLWQNKSITKLQPIPAQVFLTLQDATFPSSLAGRFPCNMVGGFHSSSSKNHHNGSNKDPSSTVSCLQLWPKVEAQLERALETGLAQADVFPRITSQLPAAST